MKVERPRSETLSASMAIKDIYHQMCLKRTNLRLRMTMKMNTINNYSGADYSSIISPNAVYMPRAIKSMHISMH